jgi:hypothetical protein
MFDMRLFRYFRRNGLASAIARRRNHDGKLESGSGFAQLVIQNEARIAKSEEPFDREDRHQVDFPAQEPACVRIVAVTLLPRPGSLYPLQIALRSWGTEKEIAT